MAPRAGSRSGRSLPAVGLRQARLDHHPGEIFLAPAYRDRQYPAYPGLRRLHTRLLRAGPRPSGPRLGHDHRSSSGSAWSWSPASPRSISWRCSRSRSSAAFASVVLSSSMSIRKSASPISSILSLTSTAPAITPISRPVAVGSGEIFGKGVGYGTQSRLQFLPEYQTDFIFAAFAEEWGFVGVVILLCPLWRDRLAHHRECLARRHQFRDAVSAPAWPSFSSSHIVINVGMNIHLLPVTGTPLPFMSYGGTHLVTEFLAARHPHGSAPLCASGPQRSGDEGVYRPTVGRIIGKSVTTDQVLTLCLINAIVNLVV